MPDGPSSSSSPPTPPGGSAPPPSQPTVTGGYDPGPPPGVDPGRDPGPPDGTNVDDPGPPAGMGGSGPPEDVQPKLDFATVRYFWKYVEPDKRKFFTVALLLLLLSSIPAVMAMVPWLLESNWREGYVHIIYWGLAGLFALGLLETVSQFFLSYWQAEISQGFTRRVRLDMFQKIGRLPAQSMSEHSVGTLAHRSTGDVMAVQEFLTPQLPQAFSNLARVLFMFVALFILTPPYALLVLILTPIIFFGVRFVNKRVQRLARTSQVESENIMTHLIEGVSGYRDLVAAGRFKASAAKFDEKLGRLMQAAVRTTVWSYMAGVLPYIGFTLLLFGYYFTMTTNQEMVGEPGYIGRILSFAGAIGMVQGTLMAVMGFLTEGAIAAPSFQELRKLLESEEIAETTDPQMPGEPQVEFRDVSFGYGNGAPPIIERMNFRISAGEFAAIVGQTGSGKTTVFHLLLRLLEPTGGQVEVGGVPIHRMSHEILRSYVGFIPQNPFIFDASIRENLLMGLPPEKVSENEMQRVIELAQLRRLIESRQSAGGVDAPVGPGGMTLSGGERQRIALGRIFLRDPQVIVCDEYTANIDNATARLIQQALADHFQGKTRIVISHQLYTVRGANRILVLERGGIGAIGSHEELIERPGLYREMWEVQKLS